LVVIVRLVQHIRRVAVAVYIHSVVILPARHAGLLPALVRYPILLAVAGVGAGGGLFVINFPPVFIALARLARIRQRFLW
jgi:hypothetical protein